MRERLNRIESIHFAKNKRPKQTEKRTLVCAAEWAEAVEVCSGVLSAEPRQGSLIVHDEDTDRSHGRAGRAVGLIPRAGAPTVRERVLEEDELNITNKSREKQQKS